MLKMIPDVSLQQFLSHVPALFLITLIKWSALFSFLSVLLFLFRKLTSGHRHVLWLLLIYGLILIPLLSGLVPYPVLQNSKSLSQRAEVMRAVNDLFFLQPLGRTACRRGWG